jgi:hypothetical protein
MLVQSTGREASCRSQAWGNARTADTGPTTASESPWVHSPPFLGSPAARKMVDSATQRRPVDALIVSNLEVVRGRTAPRRPNRCAKPLFSPSSAIHRRFCSIIKRSSRFVRNR